MASTVCRNRQCLGNNRNACDGNFIAKKMGMIAVETCSFFHVEIVGAIPALKPIKNIKPQHKGALCQNLGL